MKIVISHEINTNDFVFIVSCFLVTQIIHVNARSTSVASSMSIDLPIRLQFNSIILLFFVINELAIENDVSVFSY